MKFFELGGVRVPVEANIGFRQTYESVGVPSIIRMAGGSGIRLSSPLSLKLKTTVSASGYNPDGLDGLDWSVAHVMKCAEPRAVSGVGGSNIIPIPSARRSDAGYEPKGIAIVGGRRQFSPVVDVGDVYTVALVAGATSYQVAYYPQISVLASKRMTGNLSWVVDGEEV